MVQDDHQPNGCDKGLATLSMRMLRTSCRDSRQVLVGFRGGEIGGGEYGAAVVVAQRVRVDGSGRCLVLRLAGEDPIFGER